MKEIQIKENEEGQRLDKMLKKYLNNAAGGFIYKMLRKKNITLNGKKATGNEIIHTGDVVCLFLSDDTINKFRTTPVITKINYNKDIEILYQDKDICLVNKPAGLLSQKADSNDVSMNEIIIDYLVNSGTISLEGLSVFKPSVCNRLDRNTSGIITFGITLKGCQMLSEGFRERLFSKYYLCVVHGILKERKVIDGYLKKDFKTNRVFISSSGDSEASDYIRTEYIPVCNNGCDTFLKIKLYTGKTHQIRAHLAAIGCPVIGDYKYGDLRYNEKIKKRYSVKSQLLHAFELYIPQIDKRIFAPVPEIMLNCLKGENIWEHGTPEDLEALH